MQGKHWFVIVSLLVAASACRQLNSEYCRAHPEDPDCGEPSGMCKSEDDCFGSKPHCNMEVCVQCLEDRHCFGTRPICDAQNVCVGCQVNTDCPSSQLCLLDGSCAAPGEVAYVGGLSPDDTNDCSQTKPCATLKRALLVDPIPKYIKATGDITDKDMTTIDNKTIAIYGSPGATIARTMDGTVLEIKKAANVTLVDLEIKAGALNSDGVLIKDMPGPIVTMVRVKLSGHGGTGIFLMAGSLSLSRSEILKNRMFGIDASAGTLSIDDSRIYENTGSIGIRASSAVDMVTIGSSVIAGNTGAGGGLDIAAKFLVTNTVITGNGNAINGTIGGAFLRAQGGVFAFNTVANNVAGVTGTNGIVCGAGTRSLSNSILLDDIDITCTSVTYSLTGLVDPPLSGMGNKIGDPNFVFTTDPLDKRFYRIGVGSAAKDSADPAAREAKDIDGQERSDIRNDMGADELN